MHPGVKARMYAKHVELLGEHADEYFGLVEEAVLAHVPPDARRVLEVGCGAGATLGALKQRGCEVVGVDIEPRAVEQARLVLDAAYELDAEEDDLPDYEPGYFDLLILNYVLEHVVNPWETLRRWLVCVRPGGCVIVGVPNIAHYKVLARMVFRDEFVHEPAGILDWTHLRYFTATSIERLMTEAGLTVLEREGLSIVVEGSWKARLAVRVFPPVRRFLNFAVVVLARKELGPAPDYVPFVDSYTV